MKKALSYLLLVCLLLSLASCARLSDDTPEDMINATAEGADYRLYLPKTWNLNTVFGISGGYYSMEKQSSVSVRKYAIPADAPEENRETWFYENHCVTELKKFAVGDSFTEQDSSTALLENVNAKRFHATVILDGDTLHAVTVVGEKNNAFYVFNFLVTDELYSVLLPYAEQSLSEFVFAEPFVSDEYQNQPDESADVPSGMKIASGKKVAYRFFVPDAWEIGKNEEVVYACVSDRSNVSVIPYMPAIDNMTAEQYWDVFSEECEKYGTLSLLSKEETVLCDRTSLICDYTYAIKGETCYSYRVAIIPYRGMIYSVTYTAEAKNFSTHLDDVNNIFHTFSFR